MKKEKLTGVKQWNSTLKCYKPMRKVSRKATRHNLIYQKAKREYMREHPVCEWPGCSSVARSLHHAKGRGLYLCEVKYFKALCDFHHATLHQNPKLSREIGMMLDRIGINK